MALTVGPRSSYAVARDNGMNRMSVSEMSEDNWKVQREARRWIDRDQSKECYATYKAKEIAV